MSLLETQYGFFFSHRHTSPLTLESLSVHQVYHTLLSGGGTIKWNRRTPVGTGPRDFQEPSHCNDTISTRIHREWPYTPWHLLNALISDLLFVLTFNTMYTCTASWPLLRPWKSPYHSGKPPSTFSVSTSYLPLLACVRADSLVPWPIDFPHWPAVLKSPNPSPPGPFRRGLGT